MFSRSSYWCSRGNPELVKLYLAEVYFVMISLSVTKGKKEKVGKINPTSLIYCALSGGVALFFLGM